MICRLGCTVISALTLLAAMGCAERRGVPTPAPDNFCLLHPVDGAKWIYDTQRDLAFKVPAPVEDRWRGFLAPELRELLISAQGCQGSNKRSCKVDADPWTNARDEEVLPPITFEPASHGAFDATVRMVYRLGSPARIDEARAAETSLKFTIDFDSTSDCWQLSDLVGAGGVSLKDTLRTDPPAVAGPSPFTGTGCYECCFESSVFIPDPRTNAEAWWVDVPPKTFWHQFEALANGRQRHNFAVAVNVRGTLSPRGHFGHLGGLDRRLEIVEFSDMRPHADGACYVIIPPPVKGLPQR